MAFLALRCVACVKFTAAILVTWHLDTPASPSSSRGLLRDYSRGRFEIPEVSRMHRTLERSLSFVRGVLLRVQRRQSPRRGRRMYAL